MCVRVCVCVCQHDASVAAALAFGERFAPRHVGASGARQNHSLQMAQVDVKSVVHVLLCVFHRQLRQATESSASVSAGENQQV